MASDSSRKFVLWGALVATLLAALWVDDEQEPYPDDIAQPVQPARDASGRARADRHTHETLPVDQLGKRKFNPDADDIFSMTSWEPKRPPAASLSSQALASRQIAAAPPAPVAPPLQFEYLGRITAGEETRIFLAQADKNHVAKVGERINGQYRLDRIGEDAIELTYLPLGIRQTLLINEKNPGRMR